jgi:predicted NUDIX family NTP pyrophosphohydrolase
MTTNKVTYPCKHGVTKYCGICEFEKQSAKKISAGLVMFRIHEGIFQVLLVHPGGPFWKSKDNGVWSIPKGEPEAGENLLVTAQREFKEEIGVTATGPFNPLGSITQKSGKEVHAWAFEGDCDVTKISSNTCDIEWPPDSGKSLTIPEIDKAEFFDMDTAAKKIIQAQLPFLAKSVMIELKKIKGEL